MACRKLDTVVLWCQNQSSNTPRHFRYKAAPPSHGWSQVVRLGINPQGDVDEATGCVGAWHPRLR